MRPLLLALALLASGCSRGCVDSPYAPRPTVDAGPRAVAPSGRCVVEASRASWFEPPETGDIDVVSPACRGDRLAVFVLRGHTLSRASRSTEPGSGFDAPRVVSAGVDRLGPIADEGVDGPVAWRAPTVGSEPEADEVWVASLRGEGDAGAVDAADLHAPEGAAALGVVVATGGTTVRGSWATERSPPRSYAATLSPEGATTRWTALPEGGAEGELKAWSFGARAGLYRVEPGDGGAASLVARADDGEGAPFAAASPLLQVAPRGGTWRGRGVFLVGEFALGRRGEGCVPMGQGLCVRPGAVYLLVSGARGEPMRRVEVFARALPDAMAVSRDEATVLAVEPRAGGATTQRAARVSLTTGEVTPLVVSPPRGMGEVDHLSLVTCGGDVWMAAEVRVEGRPAAVALPLECVARPEAR